MAIPLLNLDDHTYTDLVDEALDIIPQVYTTWSNHNPSDPGIMLLEMLAWLTEMALFQVNEITDDHLLAFLALLNGDADLTTEDIDATTQETILTLRQRYRAVTTDDFEALLLETWPETDTAQALENGSLARVCCLSRTNLEAAAPTVAAPAHISLVILPELADGIEAPLDPETFPEPTTELLAGVWDFLDARRLLTVRHHVVAPDYVTIAVTAEVYLNDDVTLDFETVRNTINEAVWTFFDPYIGGDEGTGWPFGRGVYVSEVYAMLGRLLLVSHVENVSLTRLGGASSTVGIAIEAYQLVKIDLSDVILQDVHGNAETVIIITDSGGSDNGGESANPVS